MKALTITFVSTGLWNSRLDTWAFHIGQAAAFVPRQGVPPESKVFTRGSREWGRILYGCTSKSLRKIPHGFFHRTFHPKPQTLDLDGNP